jgi:hypothetical protein
MSIEGLSPDVAAAITAGAMQATKVARQAAAAAHAIKGKQESGATGFSDAIAAAAAMTSGATALGGSMDPSQVRGCGRRGGVCCV